MKDKVGLQDLPPELLALCFQFTEISDLKNCRLVSARLGDVATMSLFQTAWITVRVLSHKSLTVLEKISQHPLIAPAARNIELRLTYYGEDLASDFSLFAGKRTAAMQNVFLRAVSHPIPRDPEVNEQAKLQIQCIYDIYKEWEQMARGRHDRAKLTHYQEILEESFETYRSLFFDDQEVVCRDDAYLRRLSAALRRLPALKELIISDIIIDSLCCVECFSDEELRELCVQPLPWEGCYSFLNRPSAPPVQVLPGVFAALERASTFPARCHIGITAPADLQTSDLSANQLQCIRHVLCKATDLYFQIHMRGRPAHPQGGFQQLALGKLVHAFFDVESVKTIAFGFGADKYPVFSEASQIISLSEIIPFEKRTWPHLSCITLRSVCLHEHEIRKFTEQHRETITSVDICDATLLSGSWTNVFEHLKSLGPQLKMVDIIDPSKGGVTDDQYLEGVEMRYSRP